MPISGLKLAPLLLATHPPPPSSYSEPQQDGDGIVVTPPPSEANRRKELREIVRELIRKPRRGRPIARFFYPICPQILGLKPADAAAIAQRMRANAQAIGLGQNAKSNCKPNITVAFLGPDSGPPDKWLRYDSSAVSHLARWQRMRVLAEQGPVRAWSRTQVRDADGRPFRFDEGFTEVRYLGRLEYEVTNEITGAAVLIERGAAEGKSLRQLADYVTMRALARTNGADSEVSASTILLLFDRAEPPSGLTAFDFALLSELYAAPRNSWERSIYRRIAARTVEMERSAGEPANVSHAEPSTLRER